MSLALLVEVYRLAAESLSFAGALVIIYGGIRAIVRTLQKEVLKKPFKYHDIRLGFTAKIVFGLDFLIASDILLTLIAPSQEELLILGATVIIRTILGYFLTKEAQEFVFD
ncbi:putative membrane protein [Methanofollis sp. W23]|uniref:DUF1622 domain-containing protein n=1 Tax=Methanofollis sp. W23 TaxID=2817849 RepID=UPI001AE743EA|nr:DUF1622 domain-containing protein [Methanofollis sp. W23]MBP2145160.1 putative membrane protein [Methanofollis sp. W23]